MEKKKPIDKNGRLFGLISVIDVVVLLAVVAICGAVYMKTNVLETTSTAFQDVAIEATFEVRMVPDYVAEAVEIGDAVFDKDHATGGAIGYITSIEITEPRTIEEINDGSLEFVGSNKDVNMIITMEGKGSVSNGRYSFNRIYELGVNAARNFQTKYASITGYVSSIQQIS